MAAKFGQEMRDEFHLDPSGIHINHGSYGAVPKTVFTARQKMLEQVEFHPDTFFRHFFHNAWKENVAAACEFLSLPKESTVFVENATAGMNCMVKSIPLKAGDAILVHSWTYKAVLNACKSAADKAGAEIIELKLQLPILDKQDVVDAYAECLGTHKNIKVAVVDYIGSMPCIKFPVKQIAKVCHSHQVLCAVDGAHAPGQVELDMEDLGIDFFVGNLHKWCYAPRGCAVMWIHPKHHGTIRPILTGHLYKDALHGDFFTQGTRDGSPYLVAQEAVRFYNSIGGIGTVTSYTSNLIDQAVAHLTEVWKTGRFPIPQDMEAPNMRMIQLPATPVFPKENEGVPEDDFGDYKALMDAIFREHNLQTVTVLVNNVPYVRLSANVYNVLDDYKALGKAVLEISKR